MTWQLQEAKNKFSEVVNTSLSKGPQIISRNGRNTAVLVSYEEYQRLTAKKGGLKKALLAGGLGELEITRDTSTSGHATEFKL